MSPQNSLASVSGLRETTEQDRAHVPSAAGASAIQTEPLREVKQPTGGTFSCWCEKEELKVCFRTSRFGLVRCAACGTYRIDPPPLVRDADSPAFYSEYYAATSRDLPLRPTRPESRLSKFWRVAERVPGLEWVGESAADIGCGEGLLSSELKGAGWSSVIGIDVARSRVALARELHPSIQFYDCPLPQVPIEEHSLDLVVMDSVVEHLVEPVAFLKTVRRSMAMGSRLVMLTPNMNSGHFRFLGRRWTGMLAPHVHVFLYNQRSLSRLAESAGFVVQAHGSLHAQPYSLRQWWKWIAGGEFKRVIWTAHQELGGAFGRLIGSGPMLYLVATPSTSPQR